jgi:hypothetical protein
MQVLAGIAIVIDRGLWRSQLLAAIMLANERVTMITFVAMTVLVMRRRTLFMIMGQMSVLLGVGALA